MFVINKLPFGDLERLQAAILDYGPYAEVFPTVAKCTSCHADQCGSCKRVDGAPCGCSCGGDYAN